MSVEVLAREKRAVARGVTPSPGRFVRRAGFPPSWLPIVVIAATLAVLRGESSIDNDVLWSARFGLQVLDTGHLPRVDTYSWTAHGSPWIANSWGWNVLLGLCYRLGGLFGVWLLAIGVSIGLALLVHRAARRIGATATSAAIAFTLLDLFALVVTPRAQAVSNLFVLVLPAAVPAAITCAGRRRAAGYGAVVVLAELVWINLHSAALLGPVLVAAAGAGVALSRPRGTRHAAFLRLGLLTGATTAAILATPYGTDSFTHAIEVRNASVGLISEWAPPGFGTSAQWLGLVAIAVAVFAGWRAWRGRRWAEAAVLAVLLAASLTAVRFAPMAVVAALPEVALALNRLPVRTVIRRNMVAGAIAVLAAFAVIGIGRFATLSAQDGSPGLVAQLPAGCRVVNDYTLGGVIILLRPDVEVSVDGRNDMYGRARVIAAVNLLRGGPDVVATLDRDRVGCVLAPSQDGLVRQLRTEPGWKVVGRDSTRTLLVRTAAAG